LNSPSVIEPEIPSSPSPSLAELVTSRESVDESTRVSDVTERFRTEARLEALAVTSSSGVAVGLLERTKVLVKMSHQYGYALYARATVEKVMDRDPLVARGHDTLEPVLRRVLAREEDAVYDAVVVVDAEGRFIGTVSVKQLILHQSTALANITLERHLMDRRAQELAKINELKSSFIAHVTHELRAPVNTIVVISDVLARSSREGNVTRMEEMLALLSSSATSLRALIANVLDLSKLEAGRMDLILETFDAGLLARDVAAMTRVLVERKPIAVEVIAHDGPVMLKSDPVKLKQVLVNLASNAAKFTERGSISIAVSTEGESVLFAVEDTGMGIAADQRAAVFEPFVQVDEVHTRRHEGTGLGLAITAKLLELLGGTITLSSELGRGTRFVVRLPETLEIA
jgi:signal transduction histidine kinase